MSSRVIAGPPFRGFLPAEASDLCRRCPFYLITSSHYHPSMKSAYTLLLLTISNLFMTFAWYGHLHLFKKRDLICQAEPV